MRSGEADIKEKLLKGHRANGRTFNVHLDGHNQMVLLKGEGPSARDASFYIADDVDFAAFWHGKWKIVFLQQKAIGLDVWPEPLVPVRFPCLTDLRADPFGEPSLPGPTGRSDRGLLRGRSKCDSSTCVTLALDSTEGLRALRGVRT